MTDCEYSLNSIEKVHLAGIQTEKINSIMDLGFKEAALITTALASDKFPVDFVANIGVTNPNEKKALITKLYWIAFVDGNEIAKGMLSDKVEINPKGESTIPLLIALDLKQVFSSDTGISLMKILLMMSGLAETPTKVTIKVKPVVSFGKKEISYPGFITVNTKV